MKVKSYFGVDEQTPYEPANPDFVGYPEEDEDWWAMQDQDEVWIAEHEEF